MASYLTLYFYLLMVVYRPCYGDETPDLGEKAIIGTFELYMLTTPPTTTPVGTASPVMANKTANTSETPENTLETTVSDSTIDSSSETTVSDSITDSSSETTLSDSTTNLTSETTLSNSTTDSPSETILSFSTTDSSSETTVSDSTTDSSSETTMSNSTTNSSSGTTSPDGDAIRFVLVSRIPNATVTEIIDWLTKVYQNITTGFEDLKDISETLIGINSPTEYLPITYQVTFNVSKLSEEKAICSDYDDRCLSQQLYNTMEVIVEHKESFVGGFYVDKKQTQEAMEPEIERFKEGNIDNICGTIGEVCSNINNTCYVNNSEIICDNNCDIYLRDYNPQCTAPGSSLDVIFIKGQCVIKNGFPACDCGFSPGDIIPNFYDGTRCISSAFVVGIAAGVGGFIIVVLLGLAIGFGCKSNKKESPKDVIKAYSDSPFDSPKEELIMESGVDKSAITNPAFDNQYETFTKTEEDFPNFQPNLQHIDPTTDYTVPRPSITRDHPYTYLCSRDRL